MSILRTTDGPRRLAEPDLPPLLRTGDRMDADTFFHWYEQAPDGFRAELVGGIVYVAGSTTYAHGVLNADLSGWLGMYGFRTPGIRGVAATTIRLAPNEVPEPDASLLILPECGGQARIERGYIVGAPELVVEVAYSTWATDLTDKLAAYEAAGVREYVLVLVREPAVRWFTLRDGRFDPDAPDPDGLHRSSTFPGLWLDPVALLAGDTARLVAVVDQGTATPEHAAFVARLAAARPREGQGAAR